MYIAYLYNAMGYPGGDIVKAISELKYHLIAIALIFWYQFSLLDAMEYYVLCTITLCIVFVSWQIDDYKRRPYVYA